MPYYTSMEGERNIDSREAAESELQSLITKISRRIEDHMETPASSDKQPSKDRTEGLNALKLQAFKLKEQLRAVKEATDEAWRAELKSSTVQVFEDAEKTYQRTIIN